MDKSVYAIFDKKDGIQTAAIKKFADLVFEAEEHGLEDVIIKGSATTAIRNYAKALLADDTSSWDINPDDINDESLKKEMKKYFHDHKGDGSIADFLAQCTESDMPKHITYALRVITDHATKSDMKGEEKSDGESDGDA